MPPKQIDYNATIIHADYLTETLAIYRVKPDEPVDAFLPGQYAVLGLNHPEKGPVLRAYSIASPPHLHNEYFEFFIRYVKQPTSDNPLTHLIFEKQTGDRIHMRSKLKGKFTIEDTVGRDDPRMKVCVAAGTGLAPFTSLVYQHYHEHGTAGNHAIIHGSSYPIDLGYRSDLETIMNGGTTPRYFPTISRPRETPGWTGLTGRAETHFHPDNLPELERLLGLGDGGFNPEKCTVLICGLQGTIANTAMSLLHRGFIPEDRKTRSALGIPKDCKASLFWEQYDTVPVIDLKDPELVAELKKRLLLQGVELEEPVV
ncbi:MAG: hypothetical protein JJU11_08615 [Candidatus Sumerlaeia bacterium]|nr:hypothetical protein [Candidatus Sumerlaeia bacterium]